MAKPKTETKTDKASSNEVATSEAKDLALANPDINLEEDAGVGQENMTSDDFTIPRLTILQDLSKAVKKSEPEYIEGAEPGLIVDTVTKTLYSGEKGVHLIPVAYRKTFIEWEPRNKGGSFVKDHGAEGAKLISSCSVNDRFQNVLPGSGNILVPTAEYYVLLISEEDGSFTPFVLSMASSQLKKSRQWNTRINQLRIAKADGSGTFNPAMFYSSYIFTTVPERNDNGSWFGWKIEPGEPTLSFPNGSEAYLAAKTLRESIAKGEVKAASEPDSDHESESLVEEGDEVPM